MEFVTLAVKPILPLTSLTFRKSRQIETGEEDGEVGKASYEGRTLIDPRIHCVEKK